MLCYVCEAWLQWVCVRMLVGLVWLLFLGSCVLGLLFDWWCLAVAADQPWDFVLKPVTLSAKSGAHSLAGLLKPVTDLSL